MTDDPVNWLRQQREAALDGATIALAEHGFVRNDAGWNGTVAVGGESVRITVRLPPEFPDSLPSVIVQEPNRLERYAHIDRNGKLCLAPPSGTLLDVGRPSVIIEQALQRAIDVLSLDRPTHDADLLREFTAYWPSPDSERLHSICPCPMSEGPIALATLTGSPALSLVGPDLEAIQRWAARVGRRTAETSPIFAIRLRSAFGPPRFSDRLTFAGLLELIKQNGGIERSRGLRAWIDQTGLPAYVLLSAPVPTGDEVQFAAHLRPRKVGDSIPGFRPGRAPATRIVGLSLGQPVTRLDVQRVDAPFVVMRGGGEKALLDRTVVVIGCGAVGSVAATTLAQRGVGHLRLVDPETLKAENIHRHALGADCIGQYKTDALRELIQRRLPHVDVSRQVADGLGLWERDPDFIAAGVDAVVLATGEETVERRLNYILPPTIPRFHVWLEPMGLGGHVVASGKNRIGCIECLYRNDPIFGLVNMADLSEPGQEIQRSMAGCSGTFTPFGATNAVRAGIEVTAAVVDSLTNPLWQPALVSWVDCPADFQKVGLKLSRRGNELVTRQRFVDATFAIAGCPGCNA